MRTHTHTHTHMHTHTHTRTHTYEKFKFFNENIRSNKDSALKEMKSSFLEKFHASSQNYFKGFVQILNGCIQALVYSELLTSHSEATIRNLGKILKNQLQGISFLNLMKLSDSNSLLLKRNSIRGFSRTLSKFYTIRYRLFEFLEYLFQKAPIDGSFYTFQKHLFFSTRQSGCSLN